MVACRSGLACDRTRFKRNEPAARGKRRHKRRAPPRTELVTKWTHQARGLYIHALAMRTWGRKPLLPDETFGAAARRAFVAPIGEGPVYLHIRRRSMPGGLSTAGPPSELRRASTSPACALFRLYARETCLSTNLRRATNRRGTGGNNKSLEDVVGLCADDTVPAGDEGWYARDTILPRP